MNARPEVLNAYIAGYTGYLELQKLAGVAETASIRQKLNELRAVRVNNFSKDIPQAWFQDQALWHCRAFSVSRNFMFMEPEVANALRENAAALGKAQQALQEYAYVAPYWFQTKPEATFGEGAIDHYYNRYTLLQARAQILRQPYSELVKYLDVPAAPVGDLFYIQSLVILIEANP
ncbi:MAG: hypothetical protein EHM21_01510 [Chloroflexi bacterium]|nr:MAG: hypothetical protein EHM21_01510 [Chloroflexota bacterium]